MKKFLRRLSLTLSSFCAIAMVFSTVAHADTFNQNRIIDDGIFDNASSMSASAIDAFLNGFSQSCISPNSGFRAIDPTGYNPSTGYQYGGFVTAGQAIYDAAQAYSINPQVLITTLEKEQSLVTGQNNFAGYCNNGSQHKYAAAVGYGCPDSGTTYSYSGLNLYQRNGVTITDTGTTCVNSATKAGFTQQVIRAAWLLKFGEQRSEGNVGWAVIKGSWDNSDDPQTCYGGPMTQGTFARCPSGGTTYYDGYTTIDATSVHMDNGATAALYWYTPHFHGNQNFFSLFTGWFGSTQVPDYSWQLLSQYAFTDATKTTATGLSNLAPGQRVYIGFTVRNMGNITWSNTGANPVNVGTLRPLGHTSAFYDSTWLGYSRPTTMKEASVAPGQTATFEFWIKAPESSVSNYSAYFGLVSEGKAWMPDIGMYFGITVQPVRYTWQLTSQYAYTDATKTVATGLGGLEPGQRRYVGFTAKNTGNTTWSNTGNNPVDVGTVRPTDRASLFYDSTWLGYGRPARMKEASVAPGQTGTFEFWMTAPSRASGNFNEYFDLVIEGKTWLPDFGFNYAASVISPNYAWQLTSQYAFSDATKATGIGLNNLSPGQTAYIGFTAKNVGNITWYNTGNNPLDVGTTNPTDRSSAFCSAGLGWLGCNRPTRMKEASVAPGQTATFEFLIKAPATPGTYREYFSPVAEGAAWLPYIGFNYLITVH